MIKDPDRSCSVFVSCFVLHSFKIDDISNFATVTHMHSVVVLFCIIYELALMENTFPVYDSCEKVEVGDYQRFNKGPEVCLCSRLASYIDGVSVLSLNRNIEGDH